MIIGHGNIIGEEDAMKDSMQLNKPVETFYTTTV
jgi:hypothetical protein